MELTVRLSANIFGLITNLAFGFSEIAFIAGFTDFINYFTCRKWRRGQNFKVKRYNRIVLLASVVSMAVLTASDIVLSFHENPEKEGVPENRICISTILGETNIEGGTEAEAVQFACTQVEGDRLALRTGNYSLKSGNITCDNDISYKYKIGQFPKFNGSRIPKDNTCEENVCSACDFNLCTLIAWEDDLPGKNGTIHPSFRYSEVFDPIVMPTIVSEDLSGKLEELTKKLLKIHSETAPNDDGVIRRLLLFGSKKVKCDIAEKDRDVTRVTLWPLILSTILCSFCWLVLIVSIPFRSSAFFKMNNPMDWANSMSNDEDDTDNKDNKEAFLEIRDLDSVAVRVRWIDCKNTRKENDMKHIP